MPEERGKRYGSRSWNGLLWSVNHLRLQTDLPPLWQEAASREAAGRVLGLLQEGSPRRAPPRFWPELLAYTVPLLEAPPPPGPGPVPPPVLSSQQVLRAPVHVSRGGKRNAA